VAANSLRVASWTAVSRVTGFGRAVAVAAVLGPTYLGNVFQAVYVVPAFIYQFLVGSLFAALLVPPLVRHVDRRDARATERLASGFLTVAASQFVAVAAVGVLAAPLLLQLFVIGVDDPSVAADQRRAGSLLLALMMPQVVLLAIAGTGAAVMNAHGRFALAAGAPALENVTVIALLVVNAAVFGTGTRLAQVGTAQLLMLGLGSTGAVALHAAAQWWGAARVGVWLRPRAGWHDSEVRSVLRRAVPSLGVAGLDCIRQVAVLPVANRVPGGVVVFQLANNFANLPVALAGKPVGTALLPPLSRLFQQRSYAAVRDEFVRGTALALFLLVPVAVLYAVLAGPLAEAVALGEMRTAAGMAALAATLAALAPGVLGDGAFYVAAQASYAIFDVRSPLVSMGLRTSTSLCGTALAFTLAPGTAVLVTLGLAISAGNLLGAWNLGRRFMATLPAGAARLGPSVLRMLAASLLMAGPAHLLAAETADWIPGRAGDVVAVVAAASLGLAMYAGVQVLWRSPEPAALAGGMRSVRSHRGRRGARGRRGTVAGVTPGPR
jgi:putative peptidoglycan lipid II flippase